MAGRARSAEPYSEADCLPLSGLQHLLFCERQCALIHLEQVWRDNALTVQGQLLHARVDGAAREVRGEVCIARGVPLLSLALGLSERADVVEFHRVEPDGGGGLGVALRNLTGRWQPFPVEYKRGSPKSNACDLVQLCAQAICLEEMLGVAVSDGAMFYGTQRRRLVVHLDGDLRDQTALAAGQFHGLIDSGRTPSATRQPKCKSCSLVDVCLPARVARSAAKYLRSALRETA